ncbi:LytR C-terminal domain-containing protein [Corynebacterium kalidii]|uniref:LytR C-terminal domain-containing protein n=1 Tax=Corynebacterium kalidii TaxID=2931982 RepID=A0A9X1WPR4_9CORY|nr:LytR C-terminal domain-containing protein [Corynebacterium kalidii]
MTDQNGPRHGDDSVYDPNPDTAYDDEYAIEPAHGAAAAGGAAAGAGAAGSAGPDGADRADGAGGPPLRGLAMVLTAVAVVLIAWGVYSFVGGDDGSEDTAQDTATGQGTAGAADGTSGAGDTPRPGDGEPTGAPADDADRPDDGSTDAPDEGERPADGDAPAEGAEPGGAPAAPEVDRAATAVTVLNNSGQPVAQSTADRLRGAQWTNVGYGNLQGRIDGISEESRVYYREGDAQSQAAAEQVAGDLGIAAVAGNPDYYDRFGEAEVRHGPRADGVVVVLTGPL